MLPAQWLLQVSYLKKYCKKYVLDLAVGKLLMFRVVRRWLFMYNGDMKAVIVGVQVGKEVVAARGSLKVVVAIRWSEVIVVHFQVC